jgi:hypothetical protein
MEGVWDRRLNSLAVQQVQSLQYFQSLKPPGSQCVSTVRLERLERLKRLQSLCAPFAHKLCSGHDRLDDFLVTRATTDIAVHKMLQLVYRGIGVLV